MGTLDILTFMYLIHIVAASPSIHIRKPNKERSTTDAMTAGETKKVIICLETTYLVSVSDKVGQSKNIIKASVCFICSPF